MRQGRVVTAPDFVTASAADRNVSSVPVAAGTPIGYPPLHVHHIHIIHHTMAFPDGMAEDIHFWQTHGDFGAGPSFGIGAASTAGYIRRVPEGFAVVIDPHDPTQTFRLDSVVNDVRTGDGAALLGPWYLEIAVELAPAAEERRPAKPPSEWPMPAGPSASSQLRPPL